MNRINFNTPFEEVADRVVELYEKYVGEKWDSYEKNSFISDLYNESDYAIVLEDLPYNIETKDVFDYIINMQIPENVPEKYVDMLLDSNVSVNDMVIAVIDDSEVEFDPEKDDKHFLDKRNVITYFFDTYFEVGNFENGLEKIDYYKEYQLHLLNFMVANKITLDDFINQLGLGQLGNPDLSIKELYDLWRNDDRHINGIEIPSYSSFVNQFKK